MMKLSLGGKCSKLTVFLQNDFKEQTWEIHFHESKTMTLCGWFCFCFWRPWNRLTILKTVLSNSIEKNIDISYYVHKTIIYL